MYLADMYRKVLDHRSYVLEEIRCKLYFQSGKDMGRIYQISGEYDNSFLADIDWPGSDPQSLDVIAGLRSSEEWDRQPAFRLILERKDLSSADDLKNCELQ